MFGLLEYNKEQKCFHFNTVEFFTGNIEDLNLLTRKYNTNGYYPLAIVRVGFMDSQYFELLEEAADNNLPLEELAEYATTLSLNDLDFFIDKKDLKSVKKSN